jgi:hypothetical protein
VTERSIDALVPFVQYDPDRVLFRIHQTRHDPIHFASDKQGRFNLRDLRGTGTCYMSPSRLGAYVEAFGRLGTLRDSYIEERSLSELTLSRPVRLADITDRQVLGRYGLAGDISAGTDYEPSQRLASQLYDLGFDGVYYAARHDPAFIERSVAIFGSAADEKLFITSTNPIPDSLILEGTRQFGLLVLPG